MTTPYREDPGAIDELLSAYLDDDLSPVEREAVRASLESDPYLRERYHELTATVALLRDLPQPTLRRSFTLTAEQAEAIRPAQGIPVRQLVDDAPPVVLPFAPVALPSAAAPPPSVFAAPAPATASPEGLPANVTPLRPRPPVARLVPLFSVLSAVAAVLLIAVLAIDFNDMGNRAPAPANAARSGAPAQFSPTNASPIVAASPAATAAAAASAATAAPAAAVGGATQGTTASSANSAAIRPAPAITPDAPQATATVQPTVPPRAASVPVAPPEPVDDGPSPLVRVAEIALVLLLLGGVVGLILGLRARRQATAAG